MGRPPARSAAAPPPPAAIPERAGANASMIAASSSSTAAPSAITNRIVWSVPVYGHERGRQPPSPCHVTGADGDPHVDERVPLQPGDREREQAQHDRQDERRELAVAPSQGHRAGERHGERRTGRAGATSAPGSSASPSGRPVQRQRSERDQPDDRALRRPKARLSRWASPARAAAPDQRLRARTHAASSPSP